MLDRATRDRSDAQGDSEVLALLLRFATRSQTRCGSEFRFIETGPATPLLARQEAW